jgi:hypothetical protein
VLWPKIGRVGPTCQTSRPCNLAGQPSFLLAPPLGITLRTAFAGYIDQGDVADRPHLGSVEPVLCATSFPRIILSVTMPYFGHNEDIHGFWSIWCFSVIRCF